jgi:esterase/lipase
MSASVLRGLSATIVSLIYCFSTSLGMSLTKKLLFQPPEEYVEDSSIYHNNDNCWLKIKCENDTDTIVIFLHGNASDITMNKNFGKVLSQIGDVYIPEYSGYGAMRKLFPRRSSDFIMDCLRTFFDTVISEENGKNICIVGQSLGSHYAARLASEGYCTHLCMLSPFYSLEKLAFGFDCEKRKIDAYDTEKYIHVLRDPVNLLILHGKKDTIVPCKHAVALYDSSILKNKKVRLMTDSCHSSLNLDAVSKEIVLFCA